jgi:type II secretory pathway component PulM
MRRCDPLVTVANFSVLSTQRIAPQSNLLPDDFLTLKTIVRHVFGRERQIIQVSVGFLMRTGAFPRCWLVFVEPISPENREVELRLRSIPQGLETSATKLLASFRFASEAAPSHTHEETLMR